MGATPRAAPSFGRALAGRRGDGRAGLESPRGTEPLQAGLGPEPGVANCPLVRALHSHKIPRDMRISGQLGLNLTAGGVWVLEEEKSSHLRLARGFGIV